MKKYSDLFSLKKTPVLTIVFKPVFSHGRTYCSTKHTFHLSVYQFGIFGLFLRLTIHKVNQIVVSIRYKRRVLLKIQKKENRKNSVKFGLEKIRTNIIGITPSDLRGEVISFLDITKIKQLFSSNLTYVCRSIGIRLWRNQWRFRFFF